MADSRLLHPPSNARGMGVIVEAHDPRTERYPARDLIGMGTGALVLPLADHIYIPETGWQDQRFTESCVGHAIAQAIYIRQGAMGIAPNKRVMPSPHDIYYRARASRYGWRDIADIGSNPVAGWEVLRAAGTPDGLGIVPYDVLPFDPWHIDTPPQPHCYQRSVDYDWLHYHWVLSDDDERCREVDELLREGRPVTAALTCGQDITTWSPDDGPWRYRGPRRGSHYVVLVHVDDEGNYWAVGSWGAGYGAGGMHHIARSEIASSRTSYLATPDIDAEKVRT